MGERWGVWITQPEGEYWLHEGRPYVPWVGRKEIAEVRARELRMRCPQWRYEARRLDDASAEGRG